MLCYGELLDQERPVELAVEGLGARHFASPGLWSPERRNVRDFQIDRF